jgi:hypothetical protein
MRLLTIIILGLIISSCTEKKLLLPLRLPSFVRQVTVDLVKESKASIILDVRNFNQDNDKNNYWELINTRKYDAIFIPDKSDEAIVFFSKNPNPKNLYIQNSTFIDYPVNELKIIRTFPFNSEIYKTQKDLFKLEEYQVLVSNESDFKTRELAKIWGQGKIESKTIVIVGEDTTEKYREIEGLKLYSTPVEYNDIKENEQNVWFTLIYSPYFEFGDLISSCDFEIKHKDFSKRERSVDYHTWYLYQAILTYGKYSYKFTPKMVFYNPYLKTYIIPDGMKKCELSSMAEDLKVINYSEYKDAEI